MNLNEIKKIVEKDGAKIIVVEQDKPVLVITKFEDYKKELEKNSREEIQNKPETQQFTNNTENQSLRIEDLPV